MDKIIYTKAQLAELNTNPKLGHNWIKIINNYAEDAYKIYATWDAGLSGRLYLALPKSLQITSIVKTQYNIM
jgi:hypothetical protein